MKEEELQHLKDQAQKEKKELLVMVSKRDQDHKNQLESMKWAMEKEKQSIQEVCMLHA